MSVSPRKRQKIVSNIGYCHLRALFDRRLICLRSDQLYTLGRSNRWCDVIFDDDRVSRRHCQVLFDGLKRKVFIWDGCSLSSGVDNSNAIKGRFQRLESIHERGRNARTRASVNGLFVNGIRVKRKRCTEIFVGDEITFVYGCNVGFAVERVLCMEETTPKNGSVLKRRATNIGVDINLGLQGPDGLIPSRKKIVPPNLKIHRLGNEDLINRSFFLLGKCRDILQSSEPLLCSKASSSFDKSNKLALLENGFSSDAKSYEHRHFVRYKFRREKAILSNVRLNDSSKDASRAVDCISPKNKHDVSFRITNLQGKDHAQRNKKIQGNCNTLGVNQIYCEEEMLNEKFSSGGTTIRLNNIDSFHGQTGSKHSSVSLQELFHPVTSISRVFVATFTSDISWFLSDCEIPNLLPVTIACHNSERCWNMSPDKRTCIPFSDYPNLVVVYPPFPEVIAFGKDSKKQGIACHHPKLIVLLREDNIRVVVTSANLVMKQWTSVTNTVWWQDFPRQNSPDFLSLFPHCWQGGSGENATTSDFAAQLAGFVASLLVDVPSQADWISDFAQYNFDQASVYLVASVPGIYAPKPSFLLDPVHFLSPKKKQPMLEQRRFLGSVEASVVGLKYRFGGNADANGIQSKMIATLLGKCHQNMHGLSEVLLKRVTNIPADANAIAVVVCNPEKSLNGDSVQLGFLPKNVAKWVSPLCDSELFSFSAYIRPKEALAAISARNVGKLQLILYVSQGPNFSSVPTLKQPEHIAAVCSLISCFQRSVGLWRLQEVLSLYQWPQAQETDFVYGSSSIGTSVNAEFMAAFAAAAGKRAIHYTESEESDPEWGLWNANHERMCPSMKILFPTIERVKARILGLMSSRCLLSLSEKTWQRLRTRDIICDSVPNPIERVGCPMHVKVARRRFQSSTGSSSSGWVYCGSHNFSAAAWGQPITHSHGDECLATVGSSTLGYKLIVRNYELGVLFVVPSNPCSNATSKISNLDDVPLPFIVPPPSYRSRDKPATAQAMREAWAEMAAKSIGKGDIEDLTDTEIPGEEDEVEAEINIMVEENDEDKNYAEVLWSQIDSSES